MKTLLFLGDSITDCNHSFEPDNLGFGYVRLISDELTKNALDKNYQVQNQGHDGFTVPALRRLWKRIAPNFHPDFITILIGINDLAVIKNTAMTASVGLARFRDQYQALIEDIRIHTDCPILLLEPFIFPQPAEYSAWETELLQMSQMIRQLAIDNQLLFLPLWETLLTKANTTGFSEITTDGIHLTRSGHHLIAEHWLACAHSFGLLPPRL